MKLFKKLYAWEMRQIENPDTLLGIWMMFGVLFGAVIDNMGAGIAIGVAIGVTMYTKQKKALEDKKDKHENEKNN